jgi:hypothetical protein
MRAAQHSNRRPMVLTIFSANGKCGLQEDAANHRLAVTSDLNSEVLVLGATAAMRNQQLVIARAPRAGRCLCGGLCCAAETDMRDD